MERSEILSTISGSSFMVKSAYDDIIATAVSDSTVPNASSPTRSPPRSRKAGPFDQVPHDHRQAGAPITSTYRVRHTALHLGHEGMAEQGEL